MASPRRIISSMMTKHSRWFRTTFDLWNILVLQTPSSDGVGDPHVVLSRSELSAKTLSTTLLTLCLRLWGPDGDSGFINDRVGDGKWFWIGMGMRETMPALTRNKWECILRKVTKSCCFLIGIPALLGPGIFSNLGITCSNKSIIDSSSCSSVAETTSKCSRIVLKSWEVSWGSSLGVGANSIKEKNVKI